MVVMVSLPNLLLFTDFLLTGLKPSRSFFFFFKVPSFVNESPLSFSLEIFSNIFPSYLATVQATKCFKSSYLLSQSCLYPNVITWFTQISAMTIITFHFWHDTQSGVKLAIKGLLWANSCVESLINKQLDEHGLKYKRKYLNYHGQPTCLPSPYITLHCTKFNMKLCSM